MIDAKNAAPVWIVVSEAAPDGRVTQLEKAGFRVLRVPPTADGVDLRVTLKRLREQGMHTILCEGGGVLATSLLAADLVQRLYLFVAPVILGQDAVPAFPANALSARLRCAETRAVGRDALIVFDRNGG
jgi:diaminohydroxyphosphoribosylaminopyrimidine deaminase/5-amino-6-(5-phosphoribosylamino)uracil reductase